MKRLQTVNFEIQLLKGPPINGMEEVVTPADSIPQYELDDPARMLSMARRGSQGVRSILLKGEMRYIKDINSLVFLCSPLYDDMKVIRKWY